MDASRGTTLLLSICCGVSVLVASGSSQAVGGAPAAAASHDRNDSTAEQALRAIVRLASERVLTADTVAAAKWGTSQPIDEPAREKLELDSLASQAKRLAMDGAAVRRIFEDQITANKTVQKALFTKWQDQPATRPTGRRPDLATQVRPVLDRINNQLLAAIQQAQPVLSVSSCGGLLVTYRDAAVQNMRLNAIQELGLDQALAHTCQGP